MKIGPNILARRVIQIGFALFLIFIGWQFINFVTYLETDGMQGSSYRPPAVEGFLPVAALVGLRYLLYSGEFDFMHPAGLAILLTVMIVSFIFRKGFCGWLCPFGALSEAMALIGKKIFGRNFLLPLWLDYILRSVKYVLLAFFIGSLFILMPGNGVAAFMVTPYNAVADIKMLQFFRHISLGGLAFFGTLMGLSLFIRNFWCRYLCPYGALMGLIGWLSPTAVKRDENLCIKCGKCNKVCHARLDIQKSQKELRSPECNTCMECIDECPVKGALDVKFFSWKSLSNYRYPLLLLGAFIAITMAFKYTGHWETAITLEQYKELIKIIEQI